MISNVRRRRHVRYCLAPLLMLMHSGCYNWVEIEPGPSMPDRARVSVASGEAGSGCEDQRRFMIHEPRVEGDSLRHGRGEPEWIPMSSVCALERVSEPNKPLAIVGGVLLVGVLVLAIAQPEVCCGWE